MPDKIKVIFDGFETPEQADAFISWYMYSGEQDSSEWMEDNTDLKFVEGTHRFGDSETCEMTLQLKLHKK